MDMSGAGLVVMVAMMAVMMGGMLIGGVWGFIRRRRRYGDRDE